MVRQTRHLAVMGEWHCGHRFSCSTTIGEQEEHVHPAFIDFEQRGHARGDIRSRVVVRSFSISFLTFYTSIIDGTSKEFPKRLS